MYHMGLSSRSNIHRAVSSIARYSHCTASSSRGIIIARYHHRTASSSRGNLIARHHHRAVFSIARNHHRAVFSIARHRHRAELSIAPYHHQQTTNVFTSKPLADLGSKPTPHAGPCIMLRGGPSQCIRDIAWSHRGNSRDAHEQHYERGHRFYHASKAHGASDSRVPRLHVYRAAHHLCRARSHDPRLTTHRAPHGYHQRPDLAQLHAEVRDPQEEPYQRHQRV
jgi:hypothetical protein